MVDLTYPDRLAGIGGDTPLINSEKLAMGSKAVSNKEARQELIKEIQLALGAGLIEVELEFEHYNYAVDQALQRYRQRSSNAVEESYAFLEIQPDQSNYILPEEVIEVRQLFRRGTAGTNIGTGVFLDPFGLAFNNLYLLQTAQGSAGGLLTFDLYAGYQKTAGLLFGLYINFAWHPHNHKLTIMTRFSSTESVLMWIYNLRPDSALIKDVYARKWIRDYSIAVSKSILSQVRGKFSTVVGPQGGTSLNGESLKAEALAEMERLDKEIDTLQDGATWGYGFIQG
jgi:hypothetical protein